MKKDAQAKQVTLTVGFTLIELLVVIAIIAVLASLFLPVLGKAKSAATWSITGGAGRSPTMLLRPSRTTWTCRTSAGSRNGCRGREARGQRSELRDRHKGLPWVCPTIRLDAMKTMTTREFFHTPGLVKALRPGESVTVTDKGAASFTVTKPGRRPPRTRADLEREAREICPEAGPTVNFTAILREAKRR